MHDSITNKEWLVAHCLDDAGLLDPSIDLLDKVVKAIHLSAADYSEKQRKTVDPNAEVAYDECIEAMTETMVDTKKVYDALVIYREFY